MTILKSKCVFRTIFLSIFILLFLLGIHIITGYPHKKNPPIKIEGVLLTKPQYLLPFKLMDNNNQVFTEKNLQHKWTMMFFGFTNCGMVCPTTMAALNKMYKELSLHLTPAELPQIIMVTVDPERDSVKKMNEYVHSFNVNFKGGRAEMEDTIVLEKQLHIVAAKMEVDGQGKNHYTIDHSADILLFNPKGELQAYFSFPHQAEQMKKDYMNILNQYGT